MFHGRCSDYTGSPRRAHGLVSSTQWVFNKCQSFLAQRTPLLYLADSVYLVKVNIRQSHYLAPRGGGAHIGLVCSLSNRLLSFAWPDTAWIAMVPSHQGHIEQLHSLPYHWPAKRMTQFFSWAQSLGFSCPFKLCFFTSPGSRLASQYHSTIDASQTSVRPAIHLSSFSSGKTMLPTAEGNRISAEGGFNLQLGWGIVFKNAWRGID